MSKSHSHKSLSNESVKLRFSMLRRLAFFPTAEKSLPFVAELKGYEKHYKGKSTKTCSTFALTEALLSNYDKKILF